MDNRRFWRAYFYGMPLAAFAAVLAFGFTYSLVSWWSILIAFATLAIIIGVIYTFYKVVEGRNGG